MPDPRGDQPSGDVEWRRPWGLYAVAALLVVVVVAGGIVKLAGRGGDSGAAHTPPRKSAVPSDRRAPNAGSTPPMGMVRKLTSSAPKVVRSAARGPLLPGPAPHWEVVGVAGSGSPSDDTGRLVRIDLTNGRVTVQRTPWPSGPEPVSLVTGPGGILVRGAGSGPGYLFGHHGGDWKLIGGALGSSGRAVPGPATNRVWAQAGGRRVFWLVRMDGTPTGTSIRMPSDTAGNVTADGSGYLLEQTIEGAWELRPSGRRRVTRGTVIATGPRTFVVRPDRSGPNRTLTVIDRRSSARNTVPTPCNGPPSASPPGRVSPDGRTAAIVCGEGDRRHLTLVDLRSGHRHTVHIERPDRRHLLWSPDSHYLLALDHGGHLTGIDRTTRQVTRFAHIPRLDAIAPVRGRDTSDASSSPPKLSDKAASRSRIRR